MEISKEELLEERLIQVEDTLCTQSKTLQDLLEYLGRTDANFKTDPGTFDDWRGRLQKLRQEERVANEIHAAKKVLANHGYLVVHDRSELDAARVKQWVESKPQIDDDDIPF